MSQVNVVGRFLAVFQVIFRSSRVSESLCLLWALTLMILVPVFVSSQTVYYVDGSGDDGKDGRSPQTAWRTVGKVNQGVYAGGDQVLFRCGGVWSEELEVTSSGSAGHVITYGWYGSGARPVLEAGGELSGWNDASRWTSAGSNLWTFSSSRHPGRLWLSGVEYGISGSGAGGSTTPNSTYRWYDDGAGHLTVWASDNPARAYSSIRAANQGREALSVSGKSYVRFAGLEFRGGGTCTEVNNGDYLIFDSCAIGWGSARYCVFLRGGSDNGQMRYCQVDRYDLVSHSFQYGGDESGGNGMDNIAMQAASNWDIHDCVIADPGHSGINMTGEADQGWKSCGNKIHHNEFFMRGGDYGRALAVQSDDVGYCSNNDFYGNYIHNHAVRIQFQGDHNRFYYNIVDTTRHCPYESDAERGGAIGLFDYMMSEYNEVLNNVIMNSDGPAITLVHDDALVHHNRIANNIFFNNGRFGGGKPGLAGVEFWSWGTGTASANTIENNVFFNPTTSTPIVYRDGYNGTHKTVAQFNTAATGGDVISGNLGGDPRIGSGYKPGVSSIVMDAGISVGLSEDFDGQPVSTPPCIGAFECEGSGITAVSNPKDQTTVARAYVLNQNYPNPFNPTTTISFSLLKASTVTLKVYDVLGHEITTLLSGTVGPGLHSVVWNASEVASGIYYYTMQGDGFTASRPMIVLK